MKTFAIGDRVALSAKFLRSIGMMAGDAGFARGTVASTKPAHSGHQMVDIKWDNVSWPVPHVLSCNLTLVSRIAIDSAMAA